MAYADLMTKLKASREKVTKLNRTLEESTSKIKSQIAEEETSQGQLMTEIQAALSEELGQEVQIGSGRKPTKRRTEVTPITPGSGYDKEKVLARITTLKAEKKSWEVIAETLNAEGLKPKTAEQFAGPAVYQLFTAHQKGSKKVVAATAANGAVKDGERSPTLFK